MVYISLLADDPELRPDARAAIGVFADVAQHPGPSRPTDAQKGAALRDADAALVGRSGGGLTRALIDVAPRLRAVGVVGGSVRMAEPEYLLERGITLFNAGWAMADSVAEFTLAMMLCGLRDIPYMMDAMRRDGWGRARAPLDLGSKTVGLVGFGGIGKRVAELLAPFRCEVLAFDPYLNEAAIAAAGVAPSGLKALLQRSDVVSLHAGLTEDSEGMIGREELALMREGALFVNTARAGIADEAALVDALERGRIRAALNVFWKEPLPTDHPLRKLDNVILTPHGGGLTSDRQVRQGRSLVEDLRRCLEGKAPLHAVTPEMLDRMT